MLPGMTTQPKIILAVISCCQKRVLPKKDLSRYSTAPTNCVLTSHPKNSDIIYGWPLAMSKKMPSSQLHIYRKCTRRQSQSWVSNGYHFRPFNCQKIGFPAMPNGHCVKRTTVCEAALFFLDKLMKK